MTYEIGERVTLDGCRGTIRETIRQHNTGDLFRIDWDNEPQDNDLYKDIELTSLSQDDVRNPWLEARAPQVHWRAA